MKRNFLVLAFCFIGLVLCAQAKSIDYYSIGYNDAVNHKGFDSKYSMEKIDKTTASMTAKQKEDFIKKIQRYNLGYLDGFCSLNDIDCPSVYFDMQEVIKPSVIPSSAEYVTGNREVFSWYTNLGVIQTKTTDGHSVRVDLAFGYKQYDDTTLAELEEKAIELTAFLRRYFSGKSAYDLRISNEDAILEEIKNGINEKILSNSRIRAVEFQQKDVI